MSLATTWPPPQHRKCIKKDEYYNWLHWQLRKTVSQLCKLCYGNYKWELWYILVFLTVISLALLLKHILPVAYIFKSALEKKLGSRVLDFVFQPSNLTSWTALGRKWVGIRAMLGLRWNQRLCPHRPVSITTSRIKLLNSSVILWANSIWWSTFNATYFLLLNVKIAWEKKQYFTSLHSWLHYVFTH